MAEITASAAHDHGHGHTDTKLSNENQKFAMWLYLASEVVIFSVLIGAYVIFRLNQPDAVRQVHQGLGIALVTVNTFILLASSWAMVMGLLQMRRGNRQGMMTWIGITALMGVVFLGGQYIEYQELAHLELQLQSAPISENNELLEGITFETAEEETAFREAVGNFGMRFYAPTAFHGAHVLVGVLWALLVLYRGSKGRYDQNPVGIEIFGLYWHFVDVVWILLFTLIYLV